MLTYNTNSNTGPVCRGRAIKYFIKKILGLEHSTTNSLANINNVEEMDNYGISTLTFEEWQKVRYLFYDPKEFNRKKAGEILPRVKAILDSVKLDFFVTCGTALGFYRDGDFNPWDDDIDIDVFSENFIPVFYKLIPKLLEEGFIVRATPRGATSKMALFYNKIKVSIGAVYLENNKPDYRQGLSYQWLSKFYEDYTIYNYDGENYKLPGPCDEYLTFVYGKDWRIPLKSDNVFEYMNTENEQFK